MRVLDSSTPLWVGRGRLPTQGEPPPSGRSNIFSGGSPRLVDVAVWLKLRRLHSPTLVSTTPPIAFLLAPFIIVIAGSVQLLATMLALCEKPRLPLQNGHVREAGLRVSPKKRHYLYILGREKGRITSHSYADILHAITFSSLQRLGWRVDSTTWRPRPPPASLCASQPI